jgi:hypothetical protein
MTTQPNVVGSNQSRASGNQRRTIAACDSYSEAERAVDYLSDNGFPVERVAIIGSDLKLVEQVTGRMNYGGAAWRGAVSGAFAGLLIGWLFALFNWFQPVLATFALVLWALVFGAVIGAIFGLLVHALSGGRRDFASVRAMAPSRYEVVADEDVADQAKSALATMRRAA